MTQNHILDYSGSGKTSLLNVLAGRSTSSETVSINGKVSHGGVMISPERYRRNIAYVMQDDALMATGALEREANST